LCYFWDGVDVSISILQLFFLFAVVVCGGYELMEWVVGRVYVPLLGL
jgi:hypothetical protein